MCQSPVPFSAIWTGSRQAYGVMQQVMAMYKYCVLVCPVDSLHACSGVCVYVCLSVLPNFMCISLFVCLVFCICSFIYHPFSLYVYVYICMLVQFLSMFLVFLSTVFYALKASMQATSQACSHTWENTPCHTTQPTHTIQTYMQNKLCTTQLYDQNTQTTKYYSRIKPTKQQAKQTKTQSHWTRTLAKKGRPNTNQNIKCIPTKQQNANTWQLTFVCDKAK